MLLLLLLSAPKCTMPASSKVRNDNLGRTALEQRGPRMTAEQVMRRKPQLGAEPRREEKTKTRNEKNGYYSHSPLRRNHPGAGPA